MTTQKTLKINNNITIVLIMFFLIILSSILTFSFSVFIMQLLLACITIPLIIKKNFKTAKIYLIVFTVSLIFILLVYSANQLKYGSPYYIGGSDDLMFEQYGLSIHNSNIYNPSKLMELGIVPSWHNSSFFLVYIAVIMGFSNLFDGYSTFIPLIINVYYLIWVSMIFEYLIRKYSKFDDLRTNLSIALFALTPNIQYINSHVFRDTFNLLQVFLIIYIFDKLFSNKHFLRKSFLIALLVFLIYITYYTRTNSLVFAGALCLFIFWEKLKIKKVYLILLVIPLALSSNFLEAIQLERFVQSYSNLLNQQGGGLSSLVFGQTLLPFGIILRSLYAFITPFPDIFGLFKVPESLLYDFTMLLIYFGVLLQVLASPFIIKRVFKFDWLSISFLTLFISVIITTFTFRHIIFYYPFMVAMAIDGYMATSKKRRLQTVYFIGFIGMSLLIVYLSLKVLG